MVTTNDASLADKVEQLRNHGASVSEEQRHQGPKPYLMPEFEMMGFNYRMTDMQGAIGSVQLEKLDRFIEERDEMAEQYKQRLKDLEWLVLPDQPEGYRHGWQSFVTLVDPEKAPYSRNAIMEKLQEKGVSTRPGTHSVPTLAFYKEAFNEIPENYPNALKAHEQSMALPLHNGMGVEDVEYVIEAVLSIK